VTLSDLLAHIKKLPSVLKYLPDERDWLHIDRHWVGDVLYSLDQEGTETLVTNAMHERKERLEKSRELLVDMKPEFYKALKEC
jgi:hypothetical protein